MPGDVHFKIPNITPVQVSTIINGFDSSKAIGLDGIGPRILKSICPVFIIRVSSWMENPYGKSIWKIHMDFFLENPFFLNLF